MPTTEQLEVIQKVIDRIAAKYKFGYYEADDIRQESFLICLEALEKYDSSRPLENFIARHLSNRLKTLRRNKYYRQNVEEGTNHQKLNESKKNLMDLKSLNYDDEVDPEIFDNMSYEVDFDGMLSAKEALDKVMSELSPQMLNDFKRIANGVSVKHHKKAALYERVKEILNEEDW